MVIERTTEVAEIQQAEAFENLRSMIIIGNEVTKPLKSPQKTPVTSKPAWKLSTRFQGLVSGATSQVPNPVSKPEKQTIKKNSQFNRLVSYLQI